MSWARPAKSSFCRSLISTTVRSNRTRGRFLLDLSPIGSPCSLICGVLIGIALYSKKEEPGIGLYLAERIANIEIKGLVTSRLKALVRSTVKGSKLTRIGRPIFSVHQHRSSVIARL